MTPPSGHVLLSSAVALVAAASLLANPLGGCAAAQEPASPAAAPEAAPRSAKGVEHVLAISVDGLNPSAITQLGKSRTPAFHQMMREGATTLNARTLWGQTRTLPDHTSMLTSRRLDPARGGTGVRFNRDNGRTVQQAAGHYVPSVFDVVHDRGGSTALFSAKPKFKFFARSWATHGATDRVGRNDGRSKIDEVGISGNNRAIVGRVAAELRRDPKTFTFLHISVPDSIGHRHGFMGPAYLDAVRETDRLLGTLLRTVAGDPALRSSTVVMLTADHGGAGAGHEDPAKLADYRVPFMVWGHGVARGRDLYAINPTFRNPGTSRPAYQGAQPIRNGDVANFATHLLGLPALGGSEFNKAQALSSS
jgi:hypothetical protein